MQATIKLYDKVKGNAKLLAFATGYLMIWLLLLTEYLPFSSLPFVLALFALPFTIGATKDAGISGVYILLSVLCIILSFVVPVKTLLFFSIGFAVFVLIESYAGRVGFLGCSTLIFVAPVFQYAVNVFSFPIRLQLTALAGKLFSLSNNTVVTKGNVIFYNGYEFSVDPACMGLNMLVTSLLIAIILIGFYQKKYKRQLRWFWVLVCFAIVIILNIFSNLLRIVLLVHFVILPQDVLHELVGLICLVVYVLLPSVFIIQLITKKLAYEQMQALVKQKLFKNVVPVHLLLLCAIGFSAYYIKKADTYSDFSLKTNAVADYKPSVFTPGVVKLENKKALAYVKYIRGFYDSDHNPTICWKGSGYEFENTKIVAVDGHKIYRADLVNGNEKLFTAWWYGNGDDDNTADPFLWRWHMMRNKKKYAVINVTAATEEDLDIEINRILKHKLLLPLFSKT